MAGKNYTNILSVSSNNLDNLISSIMFAVSYDEIPLTIEGIERRKIKSGDILEEMNIDKNTCKITGDYLLSIDIPVNLIDIDDELANITIGEFSNMFNVDAEIKKRAI